MRMPFGRYKGARVEDVPTDYLEWALETWEETDERMELMTEMELELLQRERDREE